MKEEEFLKCLRSEDLQVLYKLNDDELDKLCSKLSDEGRVSIWEEIFNKIRSDVVFIKILRILSREKRNIENLISKKRVESLFELAEAGNVACASESLKCLCNFTLNNYKTAEFLEEMNAVETCLKRLGSGCAEDIKIYEIKLLFLLTAIGRSSRSKAFDGLDLIVDILKENDDEAKTCDILKLLFNILIETELDESSEKAIEIMNILKRILVCDQKKIVNDAINLLTAFHRAHLLVLIDSDYSAVDSMIKHLDILLSDLENNAKIPKDILSPVLLVLIRLAESVPPCRKYMRFKVLPKLTDVSMRPEEGTTIRNKLCRLLTSPVKSVSDVVADFLFVLCKQNVGRMVKYTGFGNAAGLLARRGLMGSSSKGGTDSEDSETEEYNRDRHLVNPILGCKEEPRENILDSMPNEQKEYLTMELVKNIDKLQRLGVIQPCKIVDGKPEPIESVLELQSSFKNQGED